MAERSFWTKAAIVVVALSATAFLLGILGRVWGFIGDLLLIFFLAYLLGSLIIQLVKRLMRIPGVQRPLAILVVYLGFIGLLGGFGFLVLPVTVQQGIELALVIPEYAANVPRYVDNVEAALGNAGVAVDLSERLPLEALDDLGPSMVRLLEENWAPIVQNAVTIVFATSLVIVISFYVVLDGGRRLNEAIKVLPANAERETRFVLRTIDETFRGYLRGMLLISMIYGVGTAVVMSAVGLPAALPVALISSILLAVPFIGDWLALALPLIVAGISGDFLALLVVAAALLFIQQVMLNLLSPRILGHAVRMPAMLVVIAVVLGARLAGVPGALLAVPTMGVVYTLSVHYGGRIRERREARELAERMQEAEESAALGEDDAEVDEAGASAETETLAGAGPRQRSSFVEQLGHVLDRSDEEGGLRAS